jgi:hypothetical protein
MTDLMTGSAMLKSPPSDMTALPPVVREPLAAGRLTGRVKPVRDLGNEERSAMLQLMATYYTKVTPQSFQDDLAEKEWVILLHDHDGGLQGFSTLMRLDEDVDGETVTAFFSGDTVISRPFWGETALPRLWGRLVFALAEEIVDRKVFWFLICSGYKTYRFLPVFFNTFYPHHSQVCPGYVRRIMDRLARRKFPGEYDATQGVVRLHRATPLKEGVADVTEERLKNPHVAFFQTVNPGHVRGDELVCLTEVKPDNLTPAGRRMLGLQRRTG